MAITLQPSDLIFEFASNGMDDIHQVWPQRTVTKPAVQLLNTAAELSGRQQCGLNAPVHMDPHVHVHPLPLTCNVTVRKLLGHPHSKSERCQLDPQGKDQPPVPSDSFV